MSDSSFQVFKKIELKPGTLLAPLPVVMVSMADPTKQAADRADDAATGAEQSGGNIITLAWNGVVNSDPPMLSISIRPERHSHDLVADGGEFVVNLVTEQLLKVCDFCGVRSGRDMDKFAVCGLTPVPAAGLESAPAIAESPITLSCRLTGRQLLGSHEMFLAEIVALEVADELLNDEGAIEFQRAGLVSYMHGSYYQLGDILGFFGYSVARPEVLKRRMGQRKTRQKSDQVSGAASAENTKKNKKPKSAKRKKNKKKKKDKQ